MANGIINDPDEIRRLIRQGARRGIGTGSQLAPGTKTLTFVSGGRVQGQFIVSESALRSAESQLTAADTAAAQESARRSRRIEFQRGGARKESTRSAAFGKAPTQQRSAGQVSEAGSQVKEAAKNVRIEEQRAARLDPLGLSSRPTKGGIRRSVLPGGLVAGRPVRIPFVQQQKPLAQGQVAGTTKDGQFIPSPFLTRINFEQQTKGFGPGKRELDRRETLKSVNTLERLSPVGRLIFQTKDVLKSPKQSLRKVPSRLILTEQRSVTPKLKGLFPLTAEEARFGFQKRAIRREERILDVLGKQAKATGDNRLFRTAQILSGTRKETAKFLRAPVTKVAPELALGFATGGTFRVGAKIVTSSKLGRRFIGTTAGQFVDKGTKIGLTTVFVGKETQEIVSAPTTEARISRVAGLPVRLSTFALGAKAEQKIFTRPGVRRSSFGDPESIVLEQQTIAAANIPKSEKKVIQKLIDVRQEFRGKDSLSPKALQPKDLPDILNPREKPKVLGALEQQARQQEVIIFGSLATQKSIRGARRAGDIDLATSNPRKLLDALGTSVGRKTTRRQQSIGLGKAEDLKLADVKPLDRLEAFPFIEPTKAPKGTSIKFVTQTEQLGRKTAGALDPSRRAKKGSKDLDDAITIAKGLRGAESNRLLKDLKKFGVIELTPNTRLPPVTRSQRDRKTALSFARTAPSQRKIASGAQRQRDLAKELDIGLGGRRTSAASRRVSSSISSSLLGRRRLSSPLSSRSPSSSRAVSSILKSRLPSKSKASKSILSNLSGFKSPSPLSGSKTSILGRSGTSSRITSSVLGGVSKSRLSGGGSRLSLITTTTRTPPRRSRTLRFKDKRVREPRVDRVFKFQPSALGIQLGVKRRKRKFLTGFEIRGVE